MLGRSPLVDDVLLRKIGTQTAPLMEPSARWVHRRVEAVSWIDERIWRRRVSIDFTIPAGLPVVRRRGGRNLYYVPVASLQKWPPLLGLDLQARGLSTHLLTSVGNGIIDDALLYALVRRTIGTLFASGVRGEILALATETDPDRAGEAYEALETAMPQWVDHRQRRRLLAIASTLVRANLLWFPILGHRGERHVVKFSYDEEIQVRPPSILQRLANGLAWSPQTTWVELDHLGDQRSCHVDVRAPEGLVAARDPRLFFVTEAEAPKPPDAGAILLNMQPVGQRLHAYVRAAEPGQAFLSVPVAAARHGFLSAALMSSAGVTAMLFFFWHWVAQMAEDLAASVAILVVVPILLGYVAVRPVAHPVAVRQVARVRDLLTISGGLSVFAAVALVHYAKLDQLGCARTLFRDLFYGELAILVLIAISWWRSGE
jgi:hypothetical protein